MAEQGKQPINFADCYVLSNNRTSAFILSFLHHFLPHRQEYTSVYQIPEFAESPIHLFQSDVELITYLEEHTTEPHAIYWANQKETAIRGAMCLFMNDGLMIFGLVTETLSPDTIWEVSLLEKLMEYCNSTQGLILYEEPAPRTTKAFMERLIP